MRKYPYQPDYAVAPGTTIRDTLEEKGLSQADLALRTGLAEKTVSQIINGIAPISYETAEKLELVLGVPASFWNARERSYRETLVKIEEAKNLEKDVDWLHDIPLAILIERGCIQESNDKRSLVREALRFFGVSSVEAWHNTWRVPAAQYRGQAVQAKRPGYVAAWLRIGEIQAQGLETKPFNASEFRRILSEVRKLTATPAADWTRKVCELCAPAGVAVVFTKEIPNAGVSGATRWVTKDKALIQLSLKYKSDDQLWFTFFHEAGHILLHGKKQVFVEFGISNATNEEQEANLYARDVLIPPEYQHRLPYLKTRTLIQDFARSVGIAPGIVVGRLQHDDLVFKSAFNDLKRKLAWSS
jgi:HTH-type transcriptional regulator / antitoxin HigA